MFVTHGLSRLPIQWRKVFRITALYGVLAAFARGTLMFLGRWSHPAPCGPHEVGCLRGRLPPAPGTRRQGLLAQVHYPADLGSALPNVKTFQYSRPEVVKALSEGYYVPHPLLKGVLAGRSQVDPPCEPAGSKTGKWPVVVFQCGLWGSFEFYTQICRDMASMGAVVVLLEHEDGTSITATDRDSGESIEYQQQPDWPYDLIQFNRRFLSRRKGELCESVAAIQAISREQTDKCAGSPIEDVLSCADAEKLVLVGHSFGACGLVHTLSQSPPELADCRGALLMDFWPGPLTTDVSGEFCEDLGAKFPVPHISLLSQVWSDIEWYGPSCRRFATGSPRCLGAAIVPGSAHYWISDLQWWAPHWLLRLIKVMGPADASTSYRSTLQAVQASLTAFLKTSARVDLAKYGLEQIPVDAVEEVTVLESVGA